MSTTKMPRLTKQRKVILEELRKVDTHPTADEVFAMVRSKLPKISLGTVYRNLEIMSTEGLIQKIDYTGGQKRFDGNPEVHAHVRCVECGRVGDVHHAPHSNLAELAGRTEFTILGCRLDYYGLCPKCAEARSN